MPEIDFIIFGDSFCRACHHLPYLGICIVPASVQKKDFDDRAGRFLPVNFGGNDARVVQHQHISFVQILGKAMKMAMLDVFSHAAQDHHARGAAMGPRMLRDELLGEKI